MTLFFLSPLKVKPSMGPRFATSPKVNCREAAREAGLGHYTGEAYAAAGLLIGIAFLKPRAQPVVSGYNNKNAHPKGWAFSLCYVLYIRP